MILTFPNHKKKSLDITEHDYATYLTSLNFDFLIRKEELKVPTSRTYEPERNVEHHASALSRTEYARAFQSSMGNEHMNEQYGF